MTAATALPAVAFASAPYSAGFLRGGPSVAASSGPRTAGPCAICKRDSWYVARDGRSYCGACWKRRPSGRTNSLRQIPAGAEQAEDSDGEVFGLCRRCGLPLGENVYYDINGQPTLHGECLAELMLQDVEDDDKACEEVSQGRKRAHRQEYDIGWRFERVPENSAYARLLNCELRSKQGLCGVAFDEETRAVRLVETSDPSACVNLEYLSLALRVRRQEGREPIFSLDPETQEGGGWRREPDRAMQSKRFEPEWLLGTSMGEVMFQADYYLKELSMGEHDQPVVGMKSCFELSEEEGHCQDWSAREWFVIRSAGVGLLPDNALVPRVELGVEAREQVPGRESFEDAPVTRPDHPLVRYAEQFTRNFDLIAERKSVINQLREVAKAVVLAKFLLDAQAELDETWFNLVGWMAVKESAARCCLEVPQLQRRRCYAAIPVRHGEIGKEGVKPSVTSLYGGVHFGLDRLGVGRIPPMKLGTGGVARLQQMSAGLMARTLSRSLQVTTSSSSRVVPGGQGDFNLWSREVPGMRGVDLSLDKFDLGTLARQERNKAFCVATGEAFWSLLSGNDKPSAAYPDVGLLRDIFNAHLCDRRDEGERFAGPDPSEAYLGHLRVLVEGERAARRARVEHFLSDRFVVGDAGDCFPPSWTVSVKIERPRVKRQLEDSCFIDSVSLDDLASATVLFDRKTEDGLRFRIYRRDNLEVRTTQENEGPEVVGVVFSANCMVQASVFGGDQIVRITQSVSSTAPWPRSPGEDAEGRPDLQYHLALQTLSGAVVVSELLPEGGATWEEQPQDLEDRGLRSRVLGSLDVRRAGLTVHDLRSYAAAHASTRGASASERRRYTQGAFEWARREAGLALPTQALPLAQRPKPATQPGSGRIAGQLKERNGPRREEDEVARNRRLARLFDACDVLRADRDVVLAAVAVDGMALERASKALQDDREVVLAAVRACGSALRFASQHLREDKEVVLAAVRRAGSALGFADEHLQGDREVVLEAARNDCSALSFASEPLRSEPDLLLELVRRDAGALAYAADGLLADHDFLLSALRANGLAAEHLPQSACADRGFMLQVVQRNCFDLRFAAEALRSDPALVLFAVRRDRRAIEYADRSGLLSQEEEELSAELRDALRDHLVALEPSCPSGHPLQRFDAPPRGTYACDECEELVQAGEPLLGCPSCCFERCRRCARRPSAAALTPGQRVRLARGQAELRGVPGTLGRRQDHGWLVRLDGHRVDKSVEPLEVDRLCAPVALPRGASLQIAGSWDDWERHAMDWDEATACFHFPLTVGGGARESFQLFAGGSSSSCLHPDMPDACPYFDHRLSGPDGAGEGRCWTIGRHPLDRARPGARYRVEAALTPDGSLEAVSWRSLDVEGGRRCGRSEEGGAGPRLQQLGQGPGPPLRLPAHDAVALCCSWDAWSAHEMAWDTERSCFVGSLTIGKQGKERFHLLLDADRRRSLHPERPDAGVESEFRLCGPDDRGRSRSWMVMGAEGDVFEVRLMLREDGCAETVDVAHLGSCGRVP